MRILFENIMLTGRREALFNSRKQEIYTNGNTSITEKGHIYPTYRIYIPHTNKVI